MTAPKPSGARNKGGRPLKYDARLVRANIGMPKKLHRVISADAKRQSLSRSELMMRALAKVYGVEL